MKKVTSQYAVIRGSKIHGHGGFAKKNILKGTKVIEYVGEKLTKLQSDKRADELVERHSDDPKNQGVYIFELNSRYDIDGDVSWNTARNLNHSCSPNCDVDIIKGQIWIMALKDIKKGEELTYNYGYDYDDFEDHPCKCGSKNCIGYIVEEDSWPSVKRKLTLMKKKR